MKLLSGLILILAGLLISSPALALDTDQDGFSDYEEMYFYYTNPFLHDSDGDGYKDREEVENGMSPRHSQNVPLVGVDSDVDGLPDGWEIKLGTDLMNPDTDGDGFVDGLEVTFGYSPLRYDKVKVEKQINISIENQELSYYFDGIMLEKFPISSGLPVTPTPIGDYSVLAKLPFVLYQGADYYYPNTKWNLRFKLGSWGNYYIHGAYWHNNFGNKMSRGCVNVPYSRMERLYKFAEVDTKIAIK